MKRTLAALLIAVFMTGSLAGCARSAGSSGEETESTPSVKTEIAGEADGSASSAETESTGEDGEARKIEAAGHEDITTLAAAETLLAEAAEKSLIPTRLEENENILCQSLLFSESGSIVETLYLAFPDSYTSIKYLDNAIIYFDTMRDGELYHAGLNTDGAMNINDFIFADEEDCRQRIVKNQTDNSPTPLDSETVIGSSVENDVTVVTTEITDPITVSTILEEALSTAFVYRADSKIVKSYSISGEGLITAVSTDYVLKNGTALPHSRIEIETDTAKSFPFPYDELGADIDPGATREVTLVFYPGTDAGFSTVKTLPQHMNMTAVLPGNTTYNIYTDEACTELFAGSDGTADLTLYIVPNAPLPEMPGSEETAEDKAEAVLEIPDIYGDIEVGDGVSAEDADHFLQLLSKNLILNRTSGGSALVMKAIYAGTNDAISSVLAGFASDGHYLTSYSGDTLTSAFFYRDSTLTSGRAGEAITCEIYEADSSWQKNMEQSEACYDFTPVTGERLTSVTEENGLINAVTELSDEEGIKALTSSVRGNGMAYTYREGDVFRTAFTFDASSNDFISLECRLLSADGNEFTFCSITFETGADAGAFVYPYAELGSHVDPEETRTFTMVFDPGAEEHFSIARTVPKYVRILPWIDREIYAVYADEACTQGYDSTTDNLTDDVTIYIK